MFEVWVPGSSDLEYTKPSFSPLLGIPTYSPGVPTRREPLIKMPSSCGTEGNCRPEKARTLNKTGEKHDHLQSPESRDQSWRSLTEN